MLKTEDLKTILIDATHGNEYPNIWTDIATAVNDYIANNAVLYVLYAGSIPPTPSALNSPPLPPYEFSLNPTVSGDALRLGAASGLAGLIAAMSIELSKTTMTGDASGVFTVLGPSPVMTCIFTFVPTPNDDHQIIMSKIAVGIINAIKGAVIVPPQLPSPAMVNVSDQSSGAITFGSIV